MFAGQRALLNDRMLDGRLICTHTMIIKPGAIPTTASDDGKDNIPLLTISAIMSTATSCHVKVLYLIWNRPRQS